MNTEKSNKPSKKKPPQSHPDLTEEQRGRIATFAFEKLLNGVQNLGDPDSDPLVKSAIRRAETMLYPEHFAGPYQFAHDLFDESQVYTEQQIADVFKRSRWNGLKSKVPVTALLLELREAFDEELSSESNSEASPGLRAYDTVQFEIMPLAKQVLRSRNFSVEHSGANAIFNEISDLFLKIALHGLSGTSNEHFEFIAVKERFLKWCFPSPAPGARAERLYRAYEIFRYATAKKWAWEKLLGVNNTGTRRSAEMLCDNLYRFEAFASSLSFPEDFLAPEEWKELESRHCTGSAQMT